MIELEVPRSLRPLVEQAHQVAKHVLRPIARKFDAGHSAYPKELDMIAALLDGVIEAGGVGIAPEARRLPRRLPAPPGASTGHRRLATVLGMIELSWGDLGLALTIPRQGLGNIALAVLATAEQRARFGSVWAAAELGGAYTAITARADGGAFVLDGAADFLLGAMRADSLLLWAALEGEGPRAFLVPRDAPGLELEPRGDNLGLRAVDSAALRLRGCRVPRMNLLGGDGAAGEVAAATHTLAAAAAVGVAQAALELARHELEGAGVKADYARPLLASSAAEAELYRLETALEVSRLLTLKAAHLADQGAPHDDLAAMAHAKASRVAAELTLRCVELAGDAGYAERELLEKWARDAQLLERVGR